MKRLTPLKGALLTGFIMLSLAAIPVFGIATIPENYKVLEKNDYKVENGSYGNSSEIITLAKNYELLLVKNENTVIANLCDLKELKCNKTRVLKKGDTMSFVNKDFLLSTVSGKLKVEDVNEDSFTIDLTVNDDMEKVGKIMIGLLFISLVIFPTLLVWILLTKKAKVAKKKADLKSKRDNLMKKEGGNENE